MNEYEQQAADFLTSLEPLRAGRFGESDPISIVFSHRGPHFDGEEIARDIFRFTLRTVKGEYSSMFGDSISNTEKRTIARNYVTGTRAHTKVFRTRNIAAKWLKENNKPSAYDILACLVKTDPGQFQNFCDEYGYDSDSAKAFIIYKKVCDEYNGLRRIFTGEELERMQEIC